MHVPLHKRGPTNTPAEHLPGVVHELQEKLVLKQSSVRNLWSEAMMLFCFEESKAFMLSDCISLFLICGCLTCFLKLKYGSREAFLLSAVATVPICKQISPSTLGRDVEVQNSTRPAE